jgi:hypothetical protein
MGKVHGGFGDFNMPGKMHTKLGIMITFRIGLIIFFPKSLAGYPGPGELFLKVIKVFLKVLDTIISLWYNRIVIYKSC